MKIQIQASVTLTKEELQQAVAEYVARNSNIDVKDADISITKDGATVIVNTDQVPEVAKEVAEPAPVTQPKAAKATTQAAKGNHREANKPSESEVIAAKEEVADVLAAGQKLLAESAATPEPKASIFTDTPDSVVETDSIEAESESTDVPEEAVGQSFLDNPTEIKRPAGDDIFGASEAKPAPLQAAAKKPNTDSIFG